jgi:NAD(P)-dependent dehydrogenase (short-subunit alcohol dehydrogenase family)
VRLQGKTAIVTGAARGLGASVAKLFHREGANVVLADVLDDEAAQLAKELGSRAVPLHLDVGDEAAWSNATRRTLEQFGALHVLVNNAVSTA